MNVKLDRLAHQIVFGTEVDICPRYSSQWAAASLIFQKLFKDEDISHLEIFWEEAEEQWATIIYQETDEVTVSFKKYGPTALQALCLTTVEYFKGVNYLNQ